MDFIGGVMIGVIGTLVLMLLVSIRALIHLCQPNQVLIFSGSHRRVGDRVFGYRLIKGGMGIRKPFLERVDSMDLTNMIIELSAMNAYAKGGVPLTVQGVANVKIAGHEPVLNNAIERFLGKSRAEIMAIAKATLEGSLRGVLATLTPEQVNEDRQLFEERLVQEVDQDMTALGLVVDTLKIQNITDDVNYLDSIGRIRNSQLVSGARIAEAIARADALVRSAENSEREVKAQVAADVAVAKADAEKRITDALTRRDALVAEEQAAVIALVAQAQADVAVQKARIDQVRSQLDADVIQPAKAECEALEQQALARVAPIVEEGKAKADALRSLAENWAAAGDSAREIFLLQKIEGIINQITATIGETHIERLTVIDSGSGGPSAGKLLSFNEQIKEIFGVDLVEKVQGLGSRPAAPEPAALETSHTVVEQPKPQADGTPQGDKPPKIR